MFLLKYLLMYRLRAERSKESELVLREKLNAGPSA
jgi:hypothetical protein